VTYEVN